MNTPTSAFGTFCWYVLATTDLEIAARFYSDLLGWECTAGGPSVLFQKNGKVLGAGFPLSEAERRIGIPPHWSVYIEVRDIERSVAMAVLLSGKVIEAPFDVPGRGRMAVIADPGGAIFSLCQTTAPRSVLRGVEGSFGWQELCVPDDRRQEVLHFYREIFEWTWDEKNQNLLLGDRPLASARFLEQESKTPPHWLPFVITTDIDDTSRLATKLGASLHAIEGEKTSLLVRDPTSAAFGLCPPTHSLASSS